MQRVGRIEQRRRVVTCNRGKLQFDPGITAKPTSRAAQSPTGLDFSLEIADPGLTSNVDGQLAKSHLRKAVVTLPVGMTANPSIAEGLGVITYYSLASGFLSGKYRAAADLGQSVRGGGIRRYLDARGFRILAALDELARAHSAKPAEIALAWLIAREGVTAPIASATSVEQLASLVRATRLELAPDEIDRLTASGD